MVNLINDLVSLEKLLLYHPTHNHNLCSEHVCEGITVEHIAIDAVVVSTLADFMLTVLKWTINGKKIPTTENPCKIVQ